MGNLISAGFMRLQKSRLFWFFIAAEAVWGAFLAWMLYYYGVKENIVLYVFMPMFYLCVPEAVFCGFYIGTDYSDGAIRNKIAVGRTRADIYLSNLAVCCSAGAAMLLTHIAVYFTAGFLLVGPAVFPQVNLLKYFCALINVAAYASLFTMISTLCAKKTDASVANIFVSLGLIVSGMYAFAFYKQPEFFADGSLNPRYVGGAARAVLGFFESALPTSSALEIMSANSYSVCLRVIFCSLAESVIIAVIGMQAFRGKNIK